MSSFPPVPVIPQRPAPPAPPRFGMTEYERDLNPIFDAELEQAVSERKRAQPLKWIFDRLQTGQFVSANVADELMKALLYSQGKGGDRLESGDLMRAVVEGLTGKRKGSYENVIRDTMGVGEQKVFPNAPAGRRRGQWDVADLLGFIADIVLDPLTYVTFGGASKGAQIAASSFADDAVRLLGKQLVQSPEQLAKLTRNKWSREILEQVAASDRPELALRGLFKNQDNLGRLMTRTYQEAYKTALNRTQAQLPQLMGDVIERAGGAPGGIDSLLEKLGGKAYEKAGERFKVRVLGTEGFTAGANAFADARRLSWEKFKNFFKQAPGVENVRNAIWGAMNKGPVGAVRKALGFRNPYQKYLRNIEREQSEFAITNASVENLRKAYRPLDGLSDAEVTQVVDYMAIKEDLAKVVAGENAAPGLEAAAKGVDKRISTAAYEMKDVFDGWQKRLDDIGQELGEEPRQFYEWYLPEVFRMRRGSPSARMSREYTFSEQRVKESGMLRFVFGVDQESADRIVRENLSGFSVDLKEMVAAKALQQAKVESRYKLMKTFREFGLDIEEMPAAIAGKIQMGGRDLTNLGMRSVDHTAFQTADGKVKYLFDYDVADIIERALKVTGPERGPIAKVFHAYMSWWKGMVLMTSGYTARNFYSNTMTQFLRHGARAFNPKEVKQSIAAVAYIAKLTNPENLGKTLDAIGLSERKLATLMNISVAGRPLKEIADEAYRRGVISENLMAFEGRSISEKIAGEGGQRFRTAVRKGNTFVENVPRFQSFLIDVVDNGTNSETLDWAAREARKWFIDYGDLTDAEQKVWKTVIPFYCVPEEAEIMTRTGWRTYPQVAIGDDVLTYNAKTDTQEWQPVLDIATFRFDGKLAHLKGKYMDFLCTGDHRWPIEKPRSRVKGKNYGGERRLVPTNILKRTDRFILSAPTKDQESVLSPRDAAILGWLVTDGYTRWRGRHLEAVIYQKKPDQVEKIRALIKPYAGAESKHPQTGVLCMRIKAGWTATIKNVYHDKFDLPGVVSRLSTVAATAMWDAMVDAEGSRGNGTIQFCQKPGPVLDAFQMLCQILNRPFGFRLRAIRGGFASTGPVGYGYVRTGSRIKGQHVHHGRKEYHGTIWCPKTANGTWVMRQNGRAICTGNTWLRKNLSNQINGIALYPELYALAPKIEKLIEYEDPGYRPELVPEWMRNEGLFAIGKVDEGLFRMFRPDFAYMDLNLLPFAWEEDRFLPYFNFEELKKDVLNATAPWIRDIASRMTTENGYNYFYRNDLGEQGDAPYLMRLFASNPGVLGFVDGLAKWFGSEDGAKLELDDSGKLQMDARMAQTLETYIPVLRQIEMLLYLPQTAFPGLQESIEAATGAKSDYEGVEMGMQMLSYYLGIKTKEVDLDREKERMGLDAYYNARDILNEARRSAPGAGLRRDESRRRTRETIRRLGG